MAARKRFKDEDFDEYRADLKEKAEAEKAEAEKVAKAGYYVRIKGTPLKTKISVRNFPCIGRGM